MSYLTVVENYNGDATEIVRERVFDAQRPSSAACKAFTVLSNKTNCSQATIKVFFNKSIIPKTYSVKYASVDNAYYKKKPIATKITSIEDPKAANE